MKIESVNVGEAQQFDGPNFKGRTGIFKTPADGPVRIGELGLEGDDIIHKEHHGGPDQAVYLYRQEDYDWWSETLGEPVAAGSFGENLTLSGLPDADMAVGSRLHFEQVILEVSAPRIPCNILAQRMGSPKFAKRFVQAERPGIYCRVIQTGSVSTGESFTIDTSTASEISIVEMFRADSRKLTRDELERFLAAPIDIRTRTKWEQTLAKI
ncbi:MAG: MOSC domain-containing protein [Gammaproteobacteria bacterium]|nr:MAG: MOSC domain-containing protein [Gammaproteobacteria bacterium]